MQARLFGSIVLISGTCVGGGMLALPLITADLSLWQSSLVLLIAWLLPTAACLVLIKIFINMPKGTNLVSISQYYLGAVGRWITYFLFLALMYSLVSAYLSTSFDVIETVFKLLHWNLVDKVVRVVFFPCLLCIIYLGTRTVDLLTRVLMLIKAVTFFLAVGLLLPSLSSNHFILEAASGSSWFSGFTWEILAVALTSFGYLIIIPTVVDYLKRDKRQVYIAVLIGSLLPLVVYLLWIIAIQGVMNHTNLLMALHAAHTQSMFLEQLNHLNINLWVLDSIRIFTSVSVFTSLLGVSLALCHFISDGLTQKNLRPSKIFVYSFAFVPPLLIGWLEPKIFILALSYAGILILLSHIILPFLIWSSEHLKSKRGV